MLPSIFCPISPFARLPNANCARVFLVFVREQLWTNDGQFKLPEPGQEYPPDLAVSILRFDSVSPSGY